MLRPLPSATMATKRPGRAESPKPTVAEKKTDENDDASAKKNITMDEHGLPRTPDGRRHVELIHAPAILEHASHAMPWLGLITFLVLSDVFKSFATWNIVVHMLIFIPTVHIPALVTGKFSYIDLSWPLGLAAMGVEVWFLGTGSFWHRAVVGLEYFLIGGRMTLWVLANWNIIRKGSELTRYQYRRLVWEDKPFFGGLVTSTKVSMQLEICEQWVWNVTWLCLPAMLAAYDQETSWSVLQILGHFIWILCIAGEFLGDAQKYAFVMQCQKDGVEARLRRKGGKVCDVGLWKYTRHPNYFFQWLGWVAICIASIPALLRLMAQVNMLTGIAFVAVLIYVPVGSYLMMVYYTGSIPAEVYTVQTRDAYKDYQKTTNMFFPGPLRALAEGKAE